MRFTPDFLDEIRARLPVSTVVGRRVKLTKKGKEFTGLSPFNSEKTPSFTVNDQKGFYHCFSSGEHGDIFRFLVEVEGLSFPEAVEKCANEAGVMLPARDEFAEERERKRASLVEIMEIAAKFFEQNLQKPVGAKARGYLAGREITAKTQLEFRMGYAGADRYALKTYLAEKDISQDQMIEAGLVIGGPDIAVSYDRFRDRVMFPIADLRGKIIAFGGRALSKDVAAKYLNSPETPLFHKGHILYNFAKARQSAFNHQQMVVAEGYMDVIAFARAGIEHAVAPLGTAMTIDQLKLLWRTVPEPILCFDGDKAGVKAGFRAMNLALPNIEPGLSLKFALLPDGQDPDDILRDFGADALNEILQNAMPLDEMLWLEHTQDGNFDTPERRAMLESGLLETVRQIQNPTIAKYYKKSMEDRLYKLFGDQRRTNANQYQNRQPQYNQNRNRYAGFGGRKPLQSGTSALKNSPLVQDMHKVQSPREIVLLMTLIHHPWLVGAFFDDISKMKFLSTELDSIYKVILDVTSTDPDLDSHSLRTHMKTIGLGQTLERLDRSITLRNFGFLMPEAEQQDVIDGWSDLYRQYRGNAMNSDVATAAIALGDDTEEQNFVRLQGIKAQRERMLRNDDN
ncbi:MAG: DNA primase [Rhizobiales bacterium]|nr:DNA primase [Hyphomicrobiales bacterium]NRB14040.1 DNA primase [Hyphomicrobiales bacterium]